MIKTFNDFNPKIGKNVYISENAVIIGNVIIGNYVNIWFGSIIRGDVHSIKIGNRTNIQDNTVIHVTADESPTSIGNGVTIGHSSIIHGCNIQNDCLIGMGAIIMDDAIIGEGSLIGAGSLIPPKMNVPKRSLVIGRPGKIIRKVSKVETSMILERSKEYIDLASIYINESK